MKEDTVGVKKCLSCKEGLELKDGYIVLVICNACVRNPQNTVSRLVLKQWKK